MFEDRKKIENRTELDQLGEFGLIEHVTQQFSIHQSGTIKGVGDDCAVIEAGDGKVKLITTDLLIEGIHFDLSYTPLRHLGYKSVAVNVSDIYAMNGTPQQITVSIAISNRFSLESIEELYEGIKIACDHYHVDLVGGDTSSSCSGLFINITAIGEAKKEEVVYRNGAKENDVIMVSGDLGGAYVGLLLLIQGKQEFLKDNSFEPDFDGKEYMIERQIKPEAQRSIIELLKAAEVQPTSMIDISDGLASELNHICHQSQVGCKVYENKIPIDQLTFDNAADVDTTPLEAAMNGGEDYELLFTVKSSDYEKIKMIPECKAIGYITDQASGLQLIKNDQTVSEIKATGWNHLQKTSE
ncbi:MAG: thiamine-phosphate kinase [Bacteroidales bacterium]|nr:thiamine-phosphate kinase [Bacteroidales bacterium]